MLIDETYLSGILHIPNIAEPEPNNRSAVILSEVIENSEREVLSFAFGWKMWEDFKTKYRSNNLSEAEKYIIDGHTYTRDGKTYHWNGLKPKDYKKSLLADIIYCRYHERRITQTTEFGEVGMDVKIGNRTSMTPKLVDAWNNFIAGLSSAQYAGGISGYTPEGNPFWYVPRRLGNGYGVSYYAYNSNGGEVSLLQFLKDFKDEYPLLELPNRPFGEMQNSFGI